MTNHIEFTCTPIVAPASVLLAREVGACVEFHGVVREMENKQSIAGLFYEAYEPMAKAMLAQIFAELAAFHPCEEIYFVHRLDWVPVGETSLYLRVLAKHRGEAFGLATRIIERLKADVPIWKRP
jgi:molybdopterin synthase catalytic subunit